MNRCRTPASPRARRALRRLGLDASSLRGSGPNGRIVEADVLRAADRVRSAADALGPTRSSRRRAIAARTLANFTQVPHFYLRAEADVTAMMAARERLLSKCTGVRVSVTDYMLAAHAHALAACPWANAIWGPDSVQTFATVDVGLVVALDDGLLIPVLHGVDKLSLPQIAAERLRLVENARAGCIAAPELEGGASSLSNLSKSRVDEFFAIIHQPQSTMLAAGRIAPRPWVQDGHLTVAPTVRLTLSADHRVLDGDPAARFLDQIVFFLENPDQLA